MLVFSSRILFVPSLSVLLTRSMSRHVSFKLEPTALSLKPLLKYTPRRGLSAFASLRQWTLAWSRRINVIIWNLFCYLVVFNNNNFLACCDVVKLRMLHFWLSCRWLMCIIICPSMAAIACRRATRNSNWITNSFYCAADFLVNHAGLQRGISSD